MFTVSFRKKLNSRLNPYKTQLLRDYRCKTAVKKKEFAFVVMLPISTRQTVTWLLPPSLRRLHGAILLRKENSLRSVSNLDSLTLK